jgi:glutathione peroxidase
MSNVHFKTFRVLFASLLLSVGAFSSVQVFAQSRNFYSHVVETVDGELFSMNSLKGKKVMVVNVASACGLTPQYEQLQELYDEYKALGFEIIAFPANDFANQESGTNEEIKEFCSMNFGITFPIMSKISVKRDDKHPLYKWLTEKNYNKKKDFPVTWNFQKFLINRDGTLHDVIAPKTSPKDVAIIDWIKDNDN